LATPHQNIYKKRQQYTHTSYNVKISPFTSVFDHKSFTFSHIEKREQAAKASVPCSGLHFFRK